MLRGSWLGLGLLLGALVLGLSPLAQAQSVSGGGYSAPTIGTTPIPSGATVTSERPE